jgi:hypothetical protein
VKSNINTIYDKKIIFTIVFVIGFSISLLDELSFVNAQENIQEDKYSNTTSTTNLTQLFGEPIYKETSRQSSNSIVLNVEDDTIKTQDSYIATGILKGVGNVIDKSNFIMTYKSDSGNTSTSTGKGIITAKDGEIATYTGQDLGITDKNGTDTYHGIIIFQTDSDGKLAFLDNLIGLYEYKSWSDGKKSGAIWEWK